MGAFRLALPGRDRARLQARRVGIAATSIAAVPAADCPARQVFGTKGGITGIIADKLDRATVGKALRARHTFAATGERMVGLDALRRPHAGRRIQRRRARRQIDYRFLGLQGWDEIAAYDHSGRIWHRDLQRETGFSERKIRIRWGGARIPDRYRWAEWRGTVSIINGTINAFAGGGFEHPEESCWRAGPTDIGFRTRYVRRFGFSRDRRQQSRALPHSHQGRIDGYVKVGDPTAGNPFVHCPTFDWEVSGAELLASDGRLRKELGGCELFLAVERIADDIDAARGERHAGDRAGERSAWLPTGLFLRPPDRRCEGVDVGDVHRLREVARAISDEGSLAKILWIMIVRGVRPR